MGETRDLGKPSPNDEDDPLHEIDELTESWHQRLTVGNLAFAERYLKNEVGFGIEVRLKENHPKKFVAFFERHKLAPDLVVGATGVDRVQMGADWYDRAVLINNIELVETPQGLASPTTVWLQESDKFFNGWPGSFKKFSRPLIGEAILRPAYWEVGFTYRRIGGVSVGPDEGGRKSVQGGAKVMNDVSDIPSPHIGYRFDYVDLVDFYRGLRIFIDDDSVRLTGLVGADLNVKIVKVFCGPV